MRHLAGVLVLLLSLGVVGAARADFDQSRAWFEALAADERTETQANLTLLGFYTYLVDGQFGKGTYEALTAFQRSLGRAQTGVLIPRDRDVLLARAADVYMALGMDLVRDKEAQSALIMPVGLLTETRTNKRGHSYATPDGGIRLETMRRPSGELPFRAIFEELSAPGGGRAITYSNYNDNRFVVSGTENERRFYTLFQNAETDSVGYSLSWTEANDDPASMLAIFIASHFTALRYMPAEEDEVKIAEAPSVARQFGAFLLPANAPDVIVLNGEVTHTLASDFRRALEARPDAGTIVLNSPGGYVDNALQVAHEVRRRGMSTLVASGMGCYSACAYIFFAGQPRYVEGELGVHQISAEVADLVLAQTTLSDVLDALDTFGVEQRIISVMLRTPPEDMYIFTVQEVAELGINIGGPVRVADISTVTTVETNQSTDLPADAAPVDPGIPGTVYVLLSLHGSEEEAQRSLDYARERWAGVLGNVELEIERVETQRGGVQFRVRLPARSLENANALCAAVKSAGGGCFVAEA